MSYWNPIGPTTITIPPTPPVDPLTRIAAALERVAFQFEQYNHKQSATVTVAPKVSKLRKRVKRA
jgi:hypothetical protein